MSLIHYIQGIRKGTEINRLEREAMKNLFLSDAMAGYDKVRKGEHEIRIKKMQNEVAARTHSANTTLHHWGIVAGVLFIAGIAAGGYFLLNQSDEPETVLVKENIEKQPDTVIVEEPEEIAGSFAEQEMQADRAEMNGKQPETVKNEEKINMPEEAKLPPDGANAVQSTSVNLTENEEITAESAEQKKPAVTPEPLMGIAAYNDYLKNNLIRPSDEECKTVTGFVSLSFSIDKNGRPHHIRIMKSLCPSADGEAIRLIQSGPPWTASESFATINIYF
jgi:hypothetical protein